MPEAKREESRKDVLRGVLTAEALAQRAITKRVRDVAQYAANTGLTPSQASFLLERSTADAIEAARNQAAKVSARSFTQQTGIDASEAEPQDEEAHRAAAVSASKGIGASFRKTVSEHMAEGVSAAVAFAGAARAMKPAIERTATTEVMQAWNGEARRQGRRASVVVMHTWLAELDACEECDGLSGQTVKAHEQFSVGDPPLHPRCRCCVESSAETAAEELVEALMTPAHAH